jgi:hypothetical protein
MKPIRTVNTSGTIEYKLPNGDYHREDGPAIKNQNGHKAWCLNGDYHREDGPAVEYPDGYKAWYLNGKLHRVNGPAVEYPNGNKDWYLNGKQLSQQEFFQITRDNKLNLL